MNCNKCNTVNQAGTKFCVNCGNNLENVTTPVVPETPELPGLANPTTVAQTPAASAPVAQTPAVDQTAPVEEPTGPLLEPITQPQLAPNLLATQAMPVVTPNAATTTQNIEPTPAQTSATPVAPNVAPSPATPVQSVQPGKPKKGINKKVLIPIIAVVLLVIVALVVLLIIKPFGGSTANELSSAKTILDPNRPIVIKEDGKYGFISSKGKQIIEPKYLEASNFYGDYAIVKIEVDDDELDYFDYKYQIINQKGKEQLEEAVYLEPEYYSEYGIWVIDNELYDDNLKQISEEGDYIYYIGQGYLTYTNYEKNISGIMTHKGKSIWEWNDSSISASISQNEYDEKDLYASVNSFSDTEREVVVSLKKKKIVYELEDPENNSIMEDKDGIFEVYSTNNYDTHTRLYFYNGKLAYENKEKDLEDLELYDREKQILQLDYGYSYDDGYTYKYYDVKNEKMLSEEPESNNSYDDEDLNELKYGFKKFESSYKYGIMAGDKILLQSKYEDIDYLGYNIFLYMKEVKNKELVLVSGDEKFSIMNVKNQKEEASFDADYINIGASNDSSFLKFEQYEDYYETSGYIVYNLITGKEKTFDKDADITLGSNYIKVEEDDKITYYNTKLESIYTTEE